MLKKEIANKIDLICEKYHTLNWFFRNFIQYYNGLFYANYRIDITWPLILLLAKYYFPNFSIFILLSNYISREEFKKIPDESVVSIADFFRFLNPAELRFIKIFFKDNKSHELFYLIKAWYFSDLKLNNSNNLIALAPTDIWKKILSYVDKNSLMWASQTCGFFNSLAHIKNLDDKTLLDKASYHVDYSSKPEFFRFNKFSMFKYFRRLVANARYLAMNDGSEIKVACLEKGKIIAQQQCPYRQQISEMEWIEEDVLAFTLYEINTLKLWDIKTNKITCLPGHSQVNSIINGNKIFFITIEDHSKIFLLNKENGYRHAQLKLNLSSHLVENVFYSEKFEYIIAVYATSNTMHAKIYNMKGEVLREIFFKDKPRHILLANNELVTVKDDLIIRWDIQTAQEIEKIDISGFFSSVVYPSFGCKYLMDSYVLLHEECPKNELIIFDLKSKRITTRISLPGNGATMEFAVLPDGRLACSGNDGFFLEINFPPGRSLPPDKYYHSTFSVS